MNILDYILAAAIATGFIYGYCKGIIKQLTFGAGIILGLLQAVLYYPTVAGWIQSYTNWADWITTPAAFAGIIICAVIVLKVAGVILAGILKLVHLQFIDRAIGAIFSTIIAIMLFVGAVTLSNDIAPDNRYTGKTTQKESLLYNYAQGFTFLIIDEADKKI